MSRRFAFTGAILASLLAGTAPAQQTGPAVTGITEWQQHADASRLSRALGPLQPQRPGVVDAYVVVVSLDSDPVFNREARETGRVLSSRFDAVGRVVVLAADEGSETGIAVGSPPNLARALARVAEVMDRKEDVLILYSTSHGSPREGINYRDPARGMAVITPQQLAALLAELKFENRLIILQACFSGQFVPALAAPRTVIATAASATRSSFGCTASNDWTFFGHALINQAMRQPDSFVRQFRRAFVTIFNWERKLGIEPSDPQLSVGHESAGWMAALDARAPKVPSRPTGNPPSEISR
ncbi:MAG TPA: C13 family peptidase [Sphingomicrobium sp.]|nr:C13 family peptidase [Sphingomicrobium sp.]